MARDLGHLAKRIATIQFGIPKNTATLVRQSALAIDQALVMSTPVLEGTARSNWIVSVGRPVQRIIKAYDPHEGTSSIGETSNMNASLEQGRQAVAGYSLTMGAIFITNNLPYIKRLNDGWSAQAPKNFIEKAIKAGKRPFRNRKVRIIT